MKVDLKELLNKQTWRLQTYTGTSDGNALLIVPKTTLSKPFFVLRSSGAYITTPTDDSLYYYFPCKNYAGSMMANTSVTITYYEIG